VIIEQDFYVYGFAWDEDFLFCGMHLIHGPYDLMNNSVVDFFFFFLSNT
jgi:hypothetical protein